VAYPPGTVFAGFTLNRVLGAGGMGTVYLARHPRLPRWDALKLLSPELSHDPEFRKRFEQEADLTASLDHRNIVLVHDRGCELDQLWIDMQYIQGIDCNQALERYGPMPFEYALRIVTEVGKGLDHAHRLGLLHRDVKPANIMLAPTGDPEEAERVLLTDFGVAKAVDARHRLTSTGNLIATLAYAAPEQIQSRPLDHRVDIYALGCVLYELLTGVVPFPENSHYDTMHAHLMKPPPRPSQLVPSLPRVFDDIVATAMAKDRDRRFDNCRELANTARAALRPAPTPAALKSNRPPAVRRPKRPARPTSARPAAPVGVAVPLPAGSPHSSLPRRAPSPWCCRPTAISVSPVERWICRGRPPSRPRRWSRCWKSAATWTSTSWTPRRVRRCADSPTAPTPTGGRPFPRTGRASSTCARTAVCGGYV